LWIWDEYNEEEEARGERSSRKGLKSYDLLVCEFGEVLGVVGTEGAQNACFDAFEDEQK